MERSARAILLHPKILGKLTEAKSSGRRLTGWRLLADAFRISLAAEFVEKSLFLQPIAGPQQFQERIVGIGCSAVGRAEIDHVGDQRTRRNFQLRSGAGLAGKEFDELAHALALLFGASREFNAHAMSGMHNPDQTFSVNLHAGGAQAEVNG